MPKFNFQLVPGIILVSPDKEKEGLIVTESEPKSRLLRGKVVAVGSDLQDGSALLKAENYAKEDDIIYFLSYEGNYDHVKIEGVKYFLVLFKDVRMRIK